MNGPFQKTKLDAQLSAMLVMPIEPLNRRRKFVVK